MIKNTLLCLLGICFGATVFADSEQTLTIGTGSAAGVYYPTGGAICRIINQKNDSDSTLCVAKVSSGSSENALSLNRKMLDFAILQEDILSDAYLGKGEKFEHHPRRNLQVLFRLYPEVFTVIARKSINAKHFVDLKGKDIGVGVSGSGDYNNLRRYLQSANEKVEGFANFFYASNRKNNRLCPDGLDGAVVTIGHPSLFIRRALEECCGQLVNLSEKAIDDLTTRYPTYIKTTIDKGTYNNDKNIHTFGVYAVLATHADVPEETVYQLTRAVFENLDALRTAHPVLERMTFDDMVNQQSVIPIHPGALRYFNEVGLIK